MIHLYCWSKPQRAGLLLNPDLLRSNAEQMRTAADVYWIDLDNPTADEERLVLEQFQPVHRLTREEIAQRRPPVHSQPDIPKVEAFPNYLLVVANPLSQAMLDRIAHAGQAGAVSSPLAQLSAILTPKILITHHREPVQAVEQLRGFLARHEEQADRGPDYLFHLILDAMVDEFAPVLDFFHAQLDGIEEQVFEKPSQQLLMRILSTKREITVLRKTLVYQREVLARLARGDSTMIAQREIAYYRNVYDHVIRFTELIESAREMVNDLMQTHLAAASHKLNEVMKVLTMISTTVLPMTLIAGIYGMNFENLPEIKWEYGYPLALVLMVVAGITSLIYFRWKKWL
jgi:magnesium transporter